MQSLGHKFLNRLKKRFSHKKQQDAVVIERQDHKVSRKEISPNALKVLYRLNKAGHAAYLVGGGVRDLLLKRTPKDFDVATNAHPEEIRKIFRNSRLIGRRFRLAHVYFYDEVIEVSTFRANSGETAPIEEGEMPIMVSDNTYGTIEEDAWRRDFTVNALYYNIENFSVVDYTGGVLDLKKRLIRMIGDPVQRYHEDPVRLLRAMRFAAKLEFSIEEKTEEPLTKLANLLWHVAPARLFDEILKLFFEGNAAVTYKILVHYGYMRILFPETYHALQIRQQKADTQFILLAMQATDERFVNDQSLNPGFLLAVLLWPAVQLKVEQQRKEQGKRLHQVLHSSIEEVFNKQLETIMIPKRLNVMMGAVWLLQYHLMRRRDKRVYRTLSHRYFRAAYDFLELRVKSGEKEHEEVYQWWKRFQSADSQEQAGMVQKLNGGDDEA